MTRILTVSSGSATPNSECSRLRDPRIFGSREHRQERRAYQPQQRNAGGAEQKRGPHLGRRSRPLVGGDHEPQDQQRRRNRGGSDDGREGFKDEASGWQICHFSALSTVQNAPGREQQASAVCCFQLAAQHRQFNNPCRYSSAARSSAHPPHRSYRHISRRRLSRRGSLPASRPQVSPPPICRPAPTADWPCRSRPAWQRCRGSPCIRRSKRARIAAARKSRRAGQRISFQPLLWPIEPNHENR